MYSCRFNVTVNAAFLIPTSCWNYMYLATRIELIPWQTNTYGLYCTGGGGFIYSRERSDRFAHSITHMPTGRVGHRIYYKTHGCILTWMLLGQSRFSTTSQKYSVTSSGISTRNSFLMTIVVLYRRCRYKICVIITK